MPLEYRVLHPRRAVVVAATGLVQMSDCEALVAQLLEESAVEEGVPVLVDARGSESDIDVRDMIHVATMARLLVKRGMDLIAIVADPGPLMLLAKAFEVAARAVGVHAAVFETMDEARVWLRIGPDVDGSSNVGPLSMRTAEGDSRRGAPIRSRSPGYFRQGP